MAATRTTFLTRFPEFTEQSVAVIDAALLDAQHRVPSSAPEWALQADDAIHLITAHLLTCRTLQLKQISLDSNAGGTDGYNSTRYGQNYLEIVQSLPYCGFVV